MRCFVPASDDELYAWIEQHGFTGLQAYLPGMRLVPAPAPTKEPTEQAMAIVEQRKAA